MEAIKAIGLLLYSSCMQQQLRSLFIEQPPSVRGVTFRLFSLSRFVDFCLRECA